MIELYRYYYLKGRLDYMGPLGGHIGVRAPFVFVKWDLQCGFLGWFFQRYVARDYRWVGLVAILARGEGPFHFCKWDFGVVLG